MPFRRSRNGIRESRQSGTNRKTKDQEPQAPEARSLKPEAYVSALTMLAVRELSEAQVRQRLARREYEADDIDLAIERLKAERALDDARTAGAIARRETAFRKRGKLRVQLALSRAGIDRTVARRAIDETFGQLEPGTLIEAALDKRLRGRKKVEDQAEYARLYRYLAGQGFDSDEIRRVLDARRRRTED